MKVKLEMPPFEVWYFILALIFSAVVFCGCANKSRHLDIAGAYASQAGTVAIGSIEVQSAPENVESAMVKYVDDVAFFSDKKKHKINILMTGTNSVQSVVDVVKNICEAFIVTAPVIVTEDTGNATNAMEVISK